MADIGTPVRNFTLSARCPQLRTDVLDLERTPDFKPLAGHNAGIYFSAGSVEREAARFRGLLIPVSKSGFAEYITLGFHAMAEVTIKIFHSLDDHRELIRTIHVITESAKTLNGLRALKILRSQFPEIGHIRSLTKTDSGWRHSRAIEPKENCSFHYKWEHYYVSPSL